MANFNPIILTSKALALIAQIQADEKAKIKITRIGVGDGSYAPDEALINATALKSEKQTFPIISSSVVNGNTVSIKALISNEMLNEGYNIKEIGIFAEDLEEQEILYALTTAKQNQWDFLPAYNNLFPSKITVDFYISVGNSRQVEITIEDHTYALYEDLHDHTENKSNPHGVTKDQVGLGNVPNVATEDQTPAFTQAEVRTALKSGEKLSTLFGKIAKWFADLKDVAFTGKYSDLSGTPESLKNPHALKFTGAATVSYDGSEDKTVEVPKASDAAPQAPGTAKAGSGKTWARSDHVHPLQTSVTGSSGSCTGNAETASKLKHIVVDGNTLDSTPGTFAFSGNNGPFPGEDWVGLQIGDSVDKFQLLVRGNRLYARQNDSGGVNVTWSEWKQYAYITDIPTIPNALKNPHPLNFTGGASGSYDGSNAKTVNIPNALSSLSDGVWKAGNTLTINSMTPLSGMISSGTEIVHVLLPLGKPVASGVGASVTALKGTLRGAQGYIDGSNEINFKSGSTYTVSTVLERAVGLLRISITKSSAFTNVANNTPVNLLTTALTVSFAASGDEPLPGPEIFGDDAGMEGPSMEDGGSQTYAPADAENAESADAESSGKSDTENAQTERTETEQAETDTVTDGDSEAVPEAEETEDEVE